MSTGFLWDERFMWHNTGLQFGPSNGRDWVEPIESLENPIAKRRIKNLLDASGLTSKLNHLENYSATDDDIIRVHHQSYLDEVRKISDTGGGNLAKRMAATHIGEKGIDIALLAAGGVISSIRSVVNGTVDNAYALIRPPGHHALAGEALGFCVFSNAAIGGAYALSQLGIDRIAYVDWDVHHGNGTQEIFWEDPRVLTISIHQENSFPPDSGGVDEIGGGEGEGLSINIPLPPGSGELVYLHAFDRVITPALKRFQPDLIIVPCGFDAGFHDPLGRMMLSSESFRLMTSRIMQTAEEICQGRIVMTHEGGYSPHSVPFHCLAVIEQLSGIRTDVVDPFLAGIKQNTSPKILQHQENAIKLSEELLANIN